MDARRGNAWRALALALVVPAIGAAPAIATDFPVDSTGDGADVSPDGICDADAGTGVACTLRAALQESNASVAADTITFQTRPFNGEVATDTIDARQRRCRRSRSPVDDQLPGLDRTVRRGRLAGRDRPTRTTVSPSTPTT